MYRGTRARKADRETIHTCLEWFDNLYSLVSIYSQSAMVSALCVSLPVFYLFP